MQADLFKKNYKNLNQGQKEAVDTIEGPTMVIAGPGTGKTTVLTLRIANILEKTDTPPDGILALTFTESGVVSMRRKLVALIGPAAYRVGIFTFHGFAEEVIRKHPEYFPRIVGGDVATESEKLSLIETILDQGAFDRIRPFGSPYHYVKGALHTISDLKRDAVSPTQFADILQREEESILSKEDLKHEKGKYAGEMKSLYKDALKNIEKNRELQALYAEYETALAREDLYDFDDMLLELLRAFKEHPDLLQSLQEEYLYFLADEHQDANQAQNTILELLSSYFDEPNLFIVGDEKQAIYRFQGASLENFLYFKKKFPTAKLIYLDENYRSHQSILDASHALAEPLPGDKELRPRLMSKGGSARGTIEVIAYPTEIDEAEGIVRCLKEELEKETEPRDISVLVRTNREISDLGRHLRNAALPVTLFQDEDVLADPDVAKLMLLLRAVNDPENETLLAETLFIDFLGLDPIEVTKALHEARHEKKPIIDIISKFPELAENFSKWVTLGKNRSALEVVTAVLDDSHLAEHLLTLPDSVEKMALLSTLYQEIATRQAHKKDQSIENFLRDIDTLEEHGARLSFASRLKKENTISVMTAHKSKGLEWKVVCIPHMVSGRWGSKRTNLDFRLPYPLGSALQSGKEEDERRLFYVALTRAKEKIMITYAAAAQDGKELVPSQFIEELPKELVDIKEGDEVGASAPLLGALARHSSRENTLWDREYLRETFLEQGLNATALNNYLECPWKYFFKNLIRIPDMMEKHQMYGTAIHFALAEMTNALRQDRSFELEDLIGSFLSCLEKQPLTKKDFEDSKKKGKEVLEAFWDSEREHWHTRALAEFNIAGVTIPLPAGEDLVLRGRLDKVDLLTEAPKNSKGQEVCVVDFKTGRPKTRNQILGETASATGNEKRQLDFYRLLLDLYDDGKYLMTNGTILFTEPDEKGRIKKETFDITSEDSEKVKQETLRVAGEILNFEFWDKECGDKDCESCKLRKVLIA
ncbi:MAG: UvrD/REP helicase, helicase / ATP-dependent helicase PcrA [Parcubacteria group bacterium]|nr:UvrD/REP helicase, helicase / ATP-dependent helicase PcrA [Parcubacteria group bacterium]